MRRPRPEADERRRRAPLRPPIDSERTATRGRRFLRALDPAGRPGAPGGGTEASGYDAALRPAESRFLRSDTHYPPPLEFPARTAADAARARRIYAFHALLCAAALRKRPRPCAPRLPSPLPNPRLRLAKPRPLSAGGATGACAAAPLKGRASTLLVQQSSGLSGFGLDRANKISR